MRDTSRSRKRGTSAVIRRAYRPLSGACTKARSAEYSDITRAPHLAAPVPQRSAALSDGAELGRSVLEIRPPYLPRNRRSSSRHTMHPPQTGRARSFFSERRISVDGARFLRQYHEATTERHRPCARNFVATCHEIRDPHTCNFVAAPRNPASGGRLVETPRTHRAANTDPDRADFRGGPPRKRRRISEFRGTTAEAITAFCPRCRRPARTPDSCFYTSEIGLYYVLRKDGMKGVEETRRGSG